MARVLLFLVLVIAPIITSKAFLVPFICEYFCEDDDSEADSTEDDEWEWDIFDCSRCSDKKPTTPSPSKANASSSSVTGLPPNFVISPPTSPLNISVSQVGTSWFLSFFPWGGTANSAPTITTTTTTTEAPAAANGTAANETAEAA